MSFSNLGVQYPSAGTDINDYKTDGIFFFDTQTAPENRPAGTNGWLKVTTGYTAIKQIWYRLGTPNSNDYQTYIRTYNDSWSNWSRFIVSKDLNPAFVQIGAFDDETNYSNRQPTGSSYYVTVGRICIANITIICNTPSTSNSYVTDVDTFPCPFNNKYAFGPFTAPNSDTNSILGGINPQGRLYFRRGKAGETYEGQIVYVTA